MHEEDARYEALRSIELLLRSGTTIPQDTVGRFPVEPPEGFVLRFGKTFPDGQTYTYVALRAAGRWYLTGKRPGQVVMTWTNLEEFIGNSPCSVATQWQEIPRKPDNPAIFDDLTPADWHQTIYGTGHDEEDKDT